MEHDFAANKEASRTPWSFTVLSLVGEGLQKLIAATLKMWSLDQQPYLYLQLVKNTSSQALSLKL